MGGAARRGGNGGGRAGGRGEAGTAPSLRPIDCAGKRNLPAGHADSS